jgi:DNA invertase Pin-like site-specific DNA recombinase
MPPVAYSYIRFSSEPQARGDSRRRQTTMAARYAAKHGLALDKTLSFRDIGVSAFRSRNRHTGALGSFMEAVQLGIIRPGSYLLVESFDRLSRDQILPAQALFLQIVQSGIILVTLIDERVYSAGSINANPYELLISLVAMMRANEESAHKSIRLKKAWTTKRARAHLKPLTARCPEWLRLDRTTGTFEIRPDRAETVRLIFREALSGKGPGAITKILNREKVPLLSGRDFADAHWHPARVRHILKSPAVIGTLIPHKTEYLNGKRVAHELTPITNYYPALIDHGEFVFVQELRKTNADRQATRAPARRQGNIFAQLARCPLCKGSMRLIVSTQPHWRYLVCSRAFMCAGCVRRGVRYPELEDAFVDLIDEFIDACPWPRSIRPAPMINVRHLASRITTLRNDRSDLVRTAERIHSRKVRPLLRLKEIDTELDNLIRERSALSVAEPSLAYLHLDRRLGELQRAAKSFDTDRWSMNAALRALFVSIEIDYPRDTLRLEWRHGGRTSLRLNPDVMSVKDGWTPTTTVPALRRLRPRRRRQGHSNSSANRPPSQTSP